MTNPETRTQYEGAILNQLVKNAEKLAVIELQFNEIKPQVGKIDILEQKIDNIYSVISFVKWLCITIIVGIAVNIFSQPVITSLFKS